MIEILLAIPSEPESKAVDWAVEIFGALIGSGAAILIYHWNNKHTRRKDFHSRDEFEKDKLRYFHFLTRESITFAEQFISGLKDFIKEYKDDISFIPELVLPDSTAIGRFVNKINHEEHFHSYRNQIPYGKNVTEIFRRVDYLYSASFLIREQFTLMSKRDREIKADVSELIKLNYQLLIGYVNNFDKDERETSLFFDLNRYAEIYRNIYTSGDFFLIKDQFLYPLGIYVARYRTEVDNSKYKDLYQHLSQASTKLVHLERNNNFAVNSIEKDLDKFNKAYLGLLHDSQSLNLFMNSNPTKKKS